MAPSPKAPKHPTSTALGVDAEGRALAEVFSGPNASTKDGSGVPVQSKLGLLQFQYDLMHQADAALRQQEELFVKHRQHWMSLIESFMFQMEKAPQEQFSLIEPVHSHDRELRQTATSSAIPTLTQEKEPSKKPPSKGHDEDPSATPIKQPNSYSQSLSEPNMPTRSKSWSGPSPSRASNSYMQTVSNDESQIEPYSPVTPGGSRIVKGNTLTFNRRAAKEKQEVKEERSCVAKLVDVIVYSDESEMAIVLIIVINALVMSFESQYVGLDVGFNLQYKDRSVSAQAVWVGAESVFKVCDWLFGVLFFIEMVVKLICFRVRYFYDSANQNLEGWEPNDWRFCFARFFHSLQGWNMLDFLCVVGFVFSKMATFSSSLNPQMVRLLRLFRVFRLVRLLRFLETLDHLYVMTTTIAGLSKVLGWAVFLLTIMLLICDLFLVQTLQVTYFDQLDASTMDEPELKKAREMYEYFGTCTRCMLSMFELTLGNWPPIARLLSEEVSEWFTLLCLVHKLTIGFAVIGVITGVILQETFKVAQTDDIILFRQKKRASSVIWRKMKTLFHALDDSGDGKLSVSEFMTIGEDPEIKMWLASLDIETDDLKTLFELIDVDASGFITFDELVSRMPRIKGGARSIDVLAMKREFYRHYVSFHSRQSTPRC